jgi:hypothetical protein
MILPFSPIHFPTSLAQLKATSKFASMGTKQSKTGPSLMATVRSAHSGHHHLKSQSEKNLEAT